MPLTSIFARMQFFNATFYIIAILTVVCGCNSSSSVKKEEDDSLQFYPPTPPRLEKEEFRHYLRTVEAHMDSLLLSRGFSGGILVAKKAEVIYERYQGFRDARKTQPLADTTALHLASTSKPFTAVAVLQLVNESKLSLDDSLQKFFPAFPYPGITVRSLLNHRSGLSNYVYFISNSKKWNKKIYLQNKDVLDFLIKEKPQKSFTADTRFSYSNTNYVLLALIVEKISGKSFPQYLREHIFMPLQMSHTYVFTNADSARSAPSFNDNGNFWRNDFLDLTYGDKNIYSTPRDLLKWDRALTGTGLLPQALLDSAFKPYSFEKPSVHNYGLGFRLMLLPNGKKVVYHFGRWHGFNAAFSRLPDEDVVVIITGNRFNREIYSAAVGAYSIFGDYRHRNGMAEEEGGNGSPGKK